MDATQRCEKEGVGCHYQPAKLKSQSNKDSIRRSSGIFPSARKSTSSGTYHQRHSLAGKYEKRHETASLQCREKIKTCAAQELWDDPQCTTFKVQNRQPSKIYLMGKKATIHNTHGLCSLAEQLNQAKARSSKGKWRSDNMNT